MSDTQQGDPLTFDEFPLPTYDEWQAAAVASLAGKPFDKLTTPSYEGIPIRPLYRREDTVGRSFTGTVPGHPPYVRGINAAGTLPTGWRIAQALSHVRPADFNLSLIHI